MPYFLIDGKSVFDFLRKPKFHFLVFSNEKSNFAEFEERIEKNGEWMDYQAFPLVPPIAEIFGADIPFCVLLRPDNHIAFISERILFDELKNYCSTKGIQF